MEQLPDLDQAVRAVEAMSPADAPLQRLAAAAQVRDDLDSLADGLLDVFVERARLAGCPWSQIGGALGVSKQAVQQRHTRSTAKRRLWQRVFDRPGRPPTFEHLTSNARTAMRYAGTEAAALGRDFAGPEHLLLGLLRTHHSTAARALASIGVSLPDVRRMIIEPSGEPRPDAAGTHDRVTPAPLGRHACEALERALREAHQFDHEIIGTQHILLGLARQRGGRAATVLQQLGADPDQTRDAVMRFMR